MATLKVEDMHCEKCVARITNTLNEAKLDFSVDLEKKTVKVRGNDEQVRKAVEELEDIGFDSEVLNIPD